MAEPHFTDPELTAIWNFLNSTAPATPALLGQPVQRRTPDAQDIAAREGLDLGPELQSLARQPRMTPRAKAPRRPHDVERSRVMRLIAKAAPTMRHEQLQERTTAWHGLGLTTPELKTWMRALGVDGAATVQACRAWNIGFAALDVILDGRQVRRRLREGATVTAVLALAAERGIDLRRP
ncbi:hypothetical protein PV726_32175 [Streptomyces europaeiscabiei]|uniref:hypothetical protein n=1 Tax=Streptomyces europaeiscabiei TaxID=146819 RepID=UPI0029A8B1B8|nr:hypothetical protein [Streptomyces europaeiscabiei]MDX3694914.1 hypothetical protein [Streptomyces europaeiscabiei]